MEDKEIIRLYFERSELAIEKTREKYGALCARIAGNMLRDPLDVEECVSDTYLALWNAIPPACPQVLRAFVARLARNQARNKLAYTAAQKRGPEMRVSLDELDSCLAAPDTVERELQVRELTRAIEAFLLTLDEDSRNLFLRRYWFFDSIEQIAAGFGFSEGRVKTRLYRIRGKLRVYLMKEGLLNE